MAPPEPAPAAGSPPPPDLGRLRIARGEAPRRRRGVSFSTVLLLALLCLGGWAYATGRLGVSSPAGKAPVVATARVAKPAGWTAPPSEVKGNGYVIARRRAALSTVLPGRLVELHAEEGQEVKEGQVVARIQHDDYDAQLVSAKRDTAVAEARLAEAGKSLAAARLDADRLAKDVVVFETMVRHDEAEATRAVQERDRKAPLVRQGIVTPDELDRLEAQVRTTAAAVEAAKGKVAAAESSRVAWGGEIAKREAALETVRAEVARAKTLETQAEVQVEKTNVRAPFDGVVVHKDAEVGEVVAATGAGGNSRGSVVTIVDPKTFEVQVEMAETRIGSIQAGDAARVKLDFEGAEAKGYPGKVRQVWPTADRQKATVEIRIVFLERPPVLKPEMGATVAFLARAGAPSEPSKAPEPVLLSKRAVATRDGKPAALVLLGDAVKVVRLRLGSERGDAVEVLEGLVGGETVVLDPAASLSDGDVVRTKEGG
jgi:RND family efflux transporter MFP subunit